MKPRDYEDMPVTDWFSMSVKPERIGVYRLRDRQMPSDPYHYSHWNGEFWGMVFMAPYQAEVHRNERSKVVYNGDYTGWCGLAEEPKEDPSLEAPIKVSKPITIQWP